MKEMDNYEIPKVNVVIFEQEDVITTSDWDEEDI